MIQLWHSENGVIINNVKYDFDDVDSVTVTKSGRKHKTRGANSKNKVGFVYMENSKQADEIAINTVGLSGAMLTILQKAYEDETPMTVYCINSATGESYIGNDCILQEFPRQQDIVEGEETYNVTLTFETFNLKQNLK